MSSDPIYDGVREGLSIYGYCKNNPLIYHDPTGLKTKNTDDTNKKQKFDIKEFKKYFKENYRDVDFKEIFKGFESFVKKNYKDIFNDLKENGFDISKLDFKKYSTLAAYEMGYGEKIGTDFGGIAFNLIMPAIVEGIFGLAGGIITGAIEMGIATTLIAQLDGPFAEIIYSAKTGLAGAISGFCSGLAKGIVENFCYFNNYENPLSTNTGAFISGFVLNFISANLMNQCNPVLVPLTVIESTVVGLSNMGGNALANSIMDNHFFGLGY